MSGKGSRPRPLSVDRKVFENNWDKIFKKKNQLKKNLLNNKTRYIINIRRD